MPMKRSAGLLLHRQRDGRLEVLLAHPGGPYWAKRDDGAWSIPKGELEPGEDPLAAARREFIEELGSSPTAAGTPLPLTPIRQKGGKLVLAWAQPGDFDVSTLRSNPVELEWPPRSGRVHSFPEVDRAAWFALGDARRKLLGSQCALLDELERLVR